MSAAARSDAHTTDTGTAGERKVTVTSTTITAATIKAGDKILSMTDTPIECMSVFPIFHDFDDGRGLREAFDITWAGNDEPVAYVPGVRMTLVG